MLTLPVPAELCGDAIQRERHTLVLQMRSEQTEAAIEHRDWSGRAGASEIRRRDAALCGPARMQELGLRAVDPALEDAGSEAADDSRGIDELQTVQTEDAPGEISGAERREQAGGVKSAPMKLTGRNAADAARDLVAERHSGNQFAA